MPQRKTSQAAKKKKPRTRKAVKKRRRPDASQWQKGLLAIAILVALVASVAYVANRLISVEQPKNLSRPRPHAAVAKQPVNAPADSVSKPVMPPADSPSTSVKPPTGTMPTAKAAKDQVPLYEVYPQRDLPPPQAPPLPASLPDQRPKVAIIIDDLGYDRDMAQKLLSLDPNLTASILPQSPFKEEIIAISRQRGVETMLHLPMEPNEYPSVDPGPGALLSSMPPDRLIAQLETELDAMPDVKGVNNHMGSRLTRESPQMQQVFSVLKQRSLYFVDSRTSAETVGRSTAKLFKVPFAERDIFLDHIDTRDFIQGQIEKLIRRAGRRGQALGIAHPHQNTYEVLNEALPELKKRVRLVPASQVVHEW